MQKTVIALGATALALFSALPAPVQAKSSCGIASYYGPGFHGRLTANGERFDSQAMTFAHRTMPFGTKIKVTNQDNGRSVVVRGTDRGPFYGNRIIDLSEGAFARIASKGQGLANVCISRV